MCIRDSFYFHLQRHARLSVYPLLHQRYQSQYIVTGGPAPVDHKARVLLLSLIHILIPNLLVEGVAHAIAQSDAPKIYVCNIMTQDGETEGYTAADHLEALLAHGEPGLVDLSLIHI